MCCTEQEVELTGWFLVLDLQLSYYTILDKSLNLSVSQFPGLLSEKLGLIISEVPLTLKSTSILPIYVYVHYSEANNLTPVVSATSFFFPGCLQSVSMNNKPTGFMNSAFRNQPCGILSYSVGNQTKWCS